MHGVVYVMRSGKTVRRTQRRASLGYWSSIRSKPCICTAISIFYDYRTNVELYPKWQKFLREQQPKTLIFWGQDDIFFTREGGEAYLKDLPAAEMHRLDSGHFAVEDCLEQIATNIVRFYDEKLMSAAVMSGSRKVG